MKEIQKNEQSNHSNNLQNEMKSTISGKCPKMVKNKVLGQTPKNGPKRPCLTKNHISNHLWSFGFRFSSWRALKTSHRRVLNDINFWPESHRARILKTAGPLGPYFEILALRPIPILKQESECLAISPNAKKHLNFSDTILQTLKSCTQTIRVLDLNFGPKSGIARTCHLWIP